MIAMLSIAILTLATLFALAAASAFHWLFLRIAFALMQPATARRVPPRSEPARGTAPLVRAFAAHR